LQTGITSSLYFYLFLTPQKQDQEVMAHKGCLLSFLCSLCLALGEDASCDDQGHVNLLQSQVQIRRTGKGGDVPPPSNYWSHSRGRVGQYGIAYDMPENLNLTAAHSWTWVHPGGINSAILWSSLIDHDKNLYVCSTGSTYKLSNDGEVMWSSNHGGENCALDGKTLYGMHQGTAQMFALDMETGKEVWTKKVANSTGSNGDMVEAYGGIIFAGVDKVPFLGDGGAPSGRLLAIDGSNGDELWSFKPDCGMWNVMAMFPDNETLNFMDMCGGSYRLGLRNGSLVWKKPGPLSFTDGGAILDAAGDMYTCSSPLLSQGNSGKGVVRKYRNSDGEKLWETTVDSPCVNFPAVSADGSTLILAPGGLAEDAITKSAKGLQPPSKQTELYNLQVNLLANNSQRSYYGKPDLEGAIIGLDTSSGKMKWKHDVEPWTGVAFALDEERAYNSLQGHGPLPHCWPSHWSGAISDQQGRVYIGRSTGDIFMYDPIKDTEQRFFTGDGILMGGLSSAPGMLVVSTCSYVHVFKF